MKVVLVDNFVFPHEGRLDVLDVHPHLGLISLASALRCHHHDVSIVDAKRLVRSGELHYCRDLYGRVADMLLAIDPDVLGFTTLGASFLFAVRVAEEIRLRRPALPVLFGGPHATLLDRAIVERVPACDIVVRHEAEETLPALLQCLAGKGNLSDIPGLTWREGRSVRSSPGRPLIADLDTLPLPAYDLYPVKELELGLLRIEAGRGCPFSCTFCSTARFFQRNYRLKSPERLVAELDRLHEQYGASEFKLDHDLFTVNKAKVAAFCQAVKSRGYRWRASARLDCVDPTLLEQMADAGCVGLYFGIETGSRRLQTVIQKRLSLELVEPTLDVATGLGIACTVSYITGYPDERTEDLADTLDGIGRAFHRPPTACLPQLHILTPEPGTPLFAEHWQTMRYDGYESPFNARFLRDDDQQFVQAAPDLFSSYFYYPTALGRRLHTFAVDAVAILRSLAPPVLLELLGVFDGRLSAMIDAWTIATTTDALHAGEQLISLVAARVGKDAPLVSHLRLAFAVERARVEAESGSGERASFDTSSFYVLAPGVTLLDGLHLLQLGLAGSAIEDASPKAALVFPYDGGVRTCVVDADIGPLLHIFETPVPAVGVLNTLGALSGSDPSPLAALDQLARWGVLRRCSGPTSSRSAVA